MRTPLIETAQTRYLLADGGIGTYLRQITGTPDLQPELLNTQDPDAVLQAHEAFADAGADILVANTFSANSARLTSLSQQQCDELCREGVRLARQAAGPDRWVLGSVGPPTMDEPHWQAALNHQVRALAHACADAILLETITSLSAAREMTRLAASHDSGLPVILSFAFAKAENGRGFALIQDSAPLSDVAAALASLPAHGFGINCGRNIDAYDFADLVSEFRQHTDKLIIARPNAGTPRTIDGRLQYPDEPTYMAEAIWNTIRAGANIIGGCCGVTPAHTQLFRQELDMLG